MGKLFNSIRWTNSEITVANCDFEHGQHIKFLSGWGQAYCRFCARYITFYERRYVTDPFTGPCDCWHR